MAYNTLANKRSAVFWKNKLTLCETFIDKNCFSIMLNALNAPHGTLLTIQTLIKGAESFMMIERLGWISKFDVIG
jgi:hypothetical protein